MKVNYFYVVLTDTPGSHFAEYFDGLLVGHTHARQVLLAFSIKSDTELSLQQTYL